MGNFSAEFDVIWLSIVAIHIASQRNISGKSVSDTTVRLPTSRVMEIDQQDPAVPMMEYQIYEGQKTAYHRSNANGQYVEKPSGSYPTR